MSPEAGFLLQDQIIPRLISAIPNVVHLIAPEDEGELVHGRAHSSAFRRILLTPGTGVNPRFAYNHQPKHGATPSPSPSTPDPQALNPANPWHELVLPTDVGCGVVVRLLFTRLAGSNLKLGQPPLLVAALNPAPHP